VFEPIKETYLHDNIPSKERATVISFGSIAHHLGGAVGLLVSGLIALNGSIQLAWICSGLSLVVITLLLRKDR
jgi:sugar phosphate permease